MTNRAKAVFTVVALAAVVTGGVAALAQATTPGKNGQIVYRNFKSLFVVNSDGSGERKLASPGRGKEDALPDWSPDGTTIAFQRCTDDCSVWTVAQSGTGLRRLGPAGDDRAEPAWAPNGRQIAYTRRWAGRKQDLFARAEIYLMNTNGGATRPITEITAAKPFSADLESAAWAPNGKQLVFSVSNSPSGEPANGRALFVINADGSGQRQLTPWSLNAGQGRLDWSPNGKLILFRVGGARRQHGDIYTIHPDGSGLKQLTRYPSPKTVELGSFSPDGKWITFSRFSAGSAYPSIYVMRPDGTAVRRVGTGLAFSPDWGPAR
ncbi:MAG: PD40 domain-containing protein [Gemmatimonadetes bacterium]|nr:PD40 domain-containing protein [Gemmatimonadota bacterium]